MRSACFERSMDEHLLPACLSLFVFRLNHLREDEFDGGVPVSAADGLVDQALVVLVDGEGDRLRLILYQVEPGQAEAVWLVLVRDDAALSRLVTVADRGEVQEGHGFLERNP